MNKMYFSIVIITSICLSFSSCTKEDLTTNIIGEYLGAFSSNANGDIDPYNIIVSKVNQTTIRISPTGNDFDSFETKLFRVNASSISSPTENNQHLETSVIFTEGISIGIVIFRNPNQGNTDDAYEYIGTKQ